MSRRLAPAILFALPIVLGGCIDRPVAKVEDVVRPIQAVRVSLAPASESRSLEHDFFRLTLIWDSGAA